MLDIIDEVSKKYDIRKKDILHLDEYKCVVREEANENYVTLYTADQAQYEWLMLNRNKMNITVKDVFYIGSKHEGLKTVYRMRMKKVFKLSKENRLRIKGEIHDRLNRSMNGYVNALFIAKQTKDMMLRDFLFKLRHFVNGRADIGINFAMEKFYQDKNGKIICLDPVFKR